MRRVLIQRHTAGSALEQKAPEEQYAQDQDKRDDDDFDETHGQNSLCDGRPNALKRKAKRLNERALF
jgi:hypothetical protein